MHVREGQTREPNLIALQAPELEALGLQAAAASPPDYELLTDVWLELKRRGRGNKAARYERRLRGLARDMLNGSGDVGPGDFQIGEMVPGGTLPLVDERIDIEKPQQLHWRHFEALAAVLWNKKGYLTYCTPASNHQGVDVVAISGNEGVLVQTKTSSADGSRLSWETVKDVVTGEASYRRRHPDITFHKVGLTNQFFNDKAREHAELNDVTLIDCAGLAEMLTQHRVTMLEVESVLYPDWDHHNESVT